MRLIMIALWHLCFCGFWICVGWNQSTLQNIFIWERPSKADRSGGAVLAIIEALFQSAFVNHVRVRLGSHHDVRAGEILQAVLAEEKLPFSRTQRVSGFLQSPQSRQTPAFSDGPNPVAHQSELTGSLREARQVVNHFLGRIHAIAHVQLPSIEPHRSGMALTFQICQEIPAPFTRHDDKHHLAMAQSLDHIRRLQSQRLVFP